MTNLFSASFIDVGCCLFSFLFRLLLLDLKSWYNFISCRFNVCFIYFVRFLIVLYRVSFFFKFFDGDTFVSVTIILCLKFLDFLSYLFLEFLYFLWSSCYTLVYFIYLIIFLGYLSGQNKVTLLMLPNFFGIKISTDGSVVKRLPNL